MAMTRNERRKAKARKVALAAIDSHNTMLVIARQERIKANLSDALFAKGQRYDRALQGGRMERIISERSGVR